MQQRSVVCAASSCEIKRRVTKAISHTAASPLRVDLQFTYLLTYYTFDIGRRGCVLWVCAT